MEMNPVLLNVLNTLAQIGLKIIVALVLYMIGRRFTHAVPRLLLRSLATSHIDPTLLRYLASIVATVLHVALVLALLSYVGVETTSFAALFAAAGVAIGVAWSGLLANFAAGLFLVILRPFKDGDIISAGGVTGTVKEIGLFSTKIDTPDNVRTYVGNNKILSDNIQNFSQNPYRRVDLLAQLDHSVDPYTVLRLLQTGLRKIPYVLSSPPPEVEFFQFTPAGPVLTVRPYCDSTHYWQVYFATTRLIGEVLEKAVSPPPEQQTPSQSDSQVSPPS